MKIVHVTDFYLPRLGGIELHVSDLARRQAERGHDVVVLTSSPSEGTEEDIPGVRVVRLTDGLGRPHAMHPAAALRGPAALAAEQPDVVHVHVGVCSPLGFWLARTAARRGTPTVVTVHSLWAQVRTIFRTLDVPGGWSRRPILWTAVSEAAAGPVRRMLPRHRVVEVLGNGIDSRHWTMPRAAARPDHVVLVTTMRLAARKRPLPLLRILREVRLRTPDTIRIDVHVIGDGPQRKAVTAYLERHGMTDWVHLGGRLSRAQIREAYVQADVFLAPADLESFGIAALEARCAGLPVVAKSGSGIAEFVPDGRHGLFASSDSEFTDAVARLVADPALRDRLSGPGGTEHVEWCAVLDRTDDIYRAASRLMSGVESGFSSVGPGD